MLFGEARLLVKPGTLEHRTAEHRNSITREHGTPKDFTSLKIMGVGIIVGIIIA
jgi:hypothetical protein